MIHSFNRMPRWGQGALMYSYQWCTQHLMWAKIWQRTGVCSLQAGIVLRLNCMTKRRTCPEDTTSHQIFLRWKRTSETHSEGCALTKTSFRSNLNYVQRALIKINVSTNPYSIKKIAEPPFYKSPWGSGLKTPVTDWFFYAMTLHSSSVTRCFQTVSCGIMLLARRAGCFLQSNRVQLTKDIKGQTKFANASKFLKLDTSVFGESPLMTSGEATQVEESSRNLCTEFMM